MPNLQQHINPGCSKRSTGLRQAEGSGSWHGRQAGRQTDRQADSSVCTMTPRVGPPGALLHTSMANRTTHSGVRGEDCRGSGCPACASVASPAPPAAAALRSALPLNPPSAESRLEAGVQRERGRVWQPAPTAAYASTGRGRAGAVQSRAGAAQVQRRSRRLGDQPGVSSQSTVAAMRGSAPHPVCRPCG